MATAPTAPIATGTQPERAVRAASRAVRRVTVLSIVVSFAVAWRWFGRAARGIARFVGVDGAGFA